MFPAGCLSSAEPPFAKSPDLLAVVELLDKHGITLHSLTEQFETGTPIGKFTLQMMGATAQLEREQISQNVQLSVQKRNQLGKWNSGNQVLGYRWISTRSIQSNRIWKLC